MKKFDSLFSCNINEKENIDLKSYTRLSYTCPTIPIRGKRCSSQQALGYPGCEDTALVPGRGTGCDQGKATHLWTHPNRRANHSQHLITTSQLPRGWIGVLAVSPKNKTSHSCNRKNYISLSFTPSEDNSTRPWLLRPKRRSLRVFGAADSNGIEGRHWEKLIKFKELILHVI